MLDQKLELTHLPQPRTLQDYQDALGRYLKIVAQIEGAKTVCQFGTFGSNTAPGISDIDLAVIVDEKITHREILKLSIKNLSKDDQEIFLHDPIVVTEETWPIVFETTGVKNFAMIGGDNYSLKIPETPPSDYQKWAMTLEYVPWYVFSIQGWLIQNDVDVRWAIPVLRSIKYLLRDNFDLKSRFYADWEDYINNINSLCDNWFMFSPNEAMMTLKLVLQKVLKIVVDVAWARDAELTTANQFLAERETLKPTTLTYFPNETVIAEKEKPKNFRNYQDDNLFYTLPQSCFRMLDVYQTTGGLIAKFLNSLSCNSWSSLPPITEFEFYLANRARLFNKHLEFLNRKRVDFGQAVTNFVYNPYLMKNKSVMGRTENRVSVILSELFTVVPRGQVWLNKIHMLMP
jgi:predicted nucleotidyltransferase